MTDAIDLTTEQRKTLNDLLRRFLPGVAVWAYGSRVKWTARPNSDLDLVAFTTPAQRTQVADLKDALAESNLPFPVDLHLWDDVPERFREIILKEYVVVQEAKQPDSRTGTADEWIEKTIGEAPIHIGDGNYSSKYPKSSEFVPAGVPFISASDMNCGRIRSQNFRYISKQQHEELQKGHLCTGDVIIVTRGNGIGNVAFVDQDFHDANINAQLVLLRADEKELHNRFLYYLLSSKEFNDELIRYGSGSAQPQIPIGSLVKILIRYPGIEEQRAIAHILGTLDDKIELNRRMNETLEAMARAFFRSWFVDFDPVRAKAEGRETGLPKHLANLFPDSFEDSELGKIPRGWGVGEIQDCCAQIQNGGTPKRNDPRYWVGGNIPWLASGEVRQPIVTATEGFITESGLTESSAKWVPAYSTVIALYGATAGQVSLVSSPLTTNQAVCAMVPKKDFAFFNYLSMRAATSDLESKAVGSAQQNISKGIVQETQVILPPTPVIERFAMLVGPLFDQWIANLCQSRTLDALRATLLPKLISGEVSVAGIEAESA